jgi:hypothetical protein
MQLVEIMIRERRMAWSVGLIWLVMISLIGMQQVGSPLKEWAYNDSTIFVVLIIVAAIPWIPRQFSLRTLLVFMTVTAVVLGLVVRMARAG